VELEERRVQVPTPVEHRGTDLRAVLAEMRSPEYLRLVGKGIGVGGAIGLLGRRLPQFAVPAAFLGGVYFAFEMMDYMQAAERRDTLGPVVEAKAIEATDVE
jgi:hypothetical protein